MKKYQCHKIVTAGKITGISRTIVLDDEGPFKLMIRSYGPYKVSKDYMKKHQPHVGGYYVLYEDGYESFSPAEAFENGYKEME